MSGFSVQCAGWACRGVAMLSLALCSSLAQAMEMPAPNPPRVEMLGARTAPQATAYGPAADAVEWTYHSTGDGAHPDGAEQQAVWLMNRARQDPRVEGAWLASCTDGDVALGRDYFQVNQAMLEAEFAALAPRAPAAFDARLYHAAKAHADDLAARDAQDHFNQPARVAAAGFSSAAMRGSVFAYADSALNAHAAWNIDWGPGPGNMQTGRGHRQATMSGDGDYTNVGLAMRPETVPSTGVGPVIAVGNYASARSGIPDHYNRFVVGTVWHDADGDAMYDPGEGVGDVMVSADQGGYFAVSAPSGGYAFPATVSGIYQITFSGQALSAPVSFPVTVGSQSVLVDLKVGAPAPTPDPEPVPGPAPSPITNWTDVYAELFSDPKEVELFRQFRDEILGRHAAGRAATAAVYGHGDALLTLLNAHPDLLTEARALIREHEAAVAAVLHGEVGVIRHPERILTFLRRVECAAGGGIGRWCRLARGLLGARIGAERPFFGFVLGPIPGE